VASAVGGLVLAVLSAGAFSLALAMLDKRQRLAPGRGVPVVVERVWQVACGRDRCFAARVRRSDRSTSVARYSMRRGVLAPGHPTRAWYVPWETYPSFIEEDIDEARRQATTLMVLGSLVGLFFVWGTAATLARYVRERRLFARGVPVAGEVVRVAPGSDVTIVRYRYPAPDGTHVETTLKVLPAWLASAPPLAPGAAIQVLYAPGNPRRHVVASLAPGASAPTPTGEASV
jgi:hypothetical protein